MPITLPNVEVNIGPQQPTAPSAPTLDDRVNHVATLVFAGLLTGLLVYWVTRDSRH